MTTNERLKLAREKRGFTTAKEAASALVVPYGTYSGHEAGSRGIKNEDLERYARFFRVRLPWLHWGEGHMELTKIVDSDSSEQEERPVALDPDAVYKVPDGVLPEIDVRAGAGGVYGRVDMVAAKTGEIAISSDVVAAEWSLPPSFVREELGLSFGRAEILKIRGDSMEPDLKDGDRVIVDRTDTNLRQGAVFAVLDGDAIIVKQVELVRETDPPRILCTSRNGCYRPTELKLDGTVHVIGRIAARISRM